MENKEREIEFELRKRKNKILIAQLAGQKRLDILI